MYLLFVALYELFIWFYNISLCFIRFKNVKAKLKIFLVSPPGPATQDENARKHFFLCTNMIEFYFFFSVQMEMFHCLYN